MAMFEEAQTTTSRKTWRAVVIGAVVPFAMITAAPAVSAAEIEQVETAVSEQLPAPGPGTPDPAAELEQCLNDVLTLLSGAPAPTAPAPGGAEQAPPAPGGPDLAPLNELCQQILTTLQGQAPAPAPAADDPVGAP